MKNMPIDRVWELAKYESTVSTNGEVCELAKEVLRLRALCKTLHEATKSLLGTMDQEIYVDFIGKL